LYYLLWQRSAWGVIDRLHQVRHFDLMHHVTFAGFRYPTAVWGHRVPCIWGPIGGIESIPAGLLPWGHPGSLVREALRNASNFLQAAPWHPLRRRARAATLVLASTPEMQKTFARLGARSRLMPAIGLSPADLPYRPHASGEVPMKMLFVGNMLALKGLDLALEALKASGVEAALTLVGSGPYLPAAKGKAEALGLGGRVSFQGRLPRDQVLKLYAEYDLFLFPSLHDTGGCAMIEAMFNELPVLCLDCGGPAVAVRDGCGMRVPLGPRARVVAGLAKGITAYARNRSTLAEHGRAAREVILRDYDWDMKGRQMDACYEEAIVNFGL
jgi:glycosyltransferase involved in cell wall biosynthesis